MRVLGRRDPFGQRPLYWAKPGNEVVTARSSGELFEKSVAKRLASRAAAAALAGSLPATWSLFQGVFRVPPGHELVAGKEALRSVPWWEPPLPDETVSIPRDPAASLLSLLRKAVERHLHDSPANILLSGGLDSAALLALAARTARPVRAFTLVAGFSGQEDIDRAGALADAFGAEHVLVTVQDEALPDAMAAAIRACEEPLWNAAAAARRIFFEALAARGVTIALSGVGADEVLCGNPEGLLAQSGRADAERAVAVALLTPAARDGLLPREAPVVRGHLPPLLRAQDAAVRETLPESTLPPECRLSSACGVDVRLPYLDREFAEFALRLPLSLRARAGLGKILLREATSGLLPDEIRWQTKTPRLAPSGGGSRSAREAWAAFHRRWLSAEALARLECVEPAVAAAALSRPREDPRERAVDDAVRLRLASLSILAEAP